MGSVLHVQEAKQCLLALWPIEKRGFQKFHGLTVIFASKTLLLSFSANCVCSRYPRQHCVACCHTGELTTLISQYQFRSFEVSPRRSKTLSSLSNRASNGSDSRSHLPIRAFGY